MLEQSETEWMNRQCLYSITAKVISNRDIVEGRSMPLSDVINRSSSSMRGRKWRRFKVWNKSISIIARKCLLQSTFSNICFKMIRYGGSVEWGCVLRGIYEKDKKIYSCLLRHLPYVLSEWEESACVGGWVAGSGGGDARVAVAVSVSVDGVCVGILKIRRLWCRRRLCRTRRWNRKNRPPCTIPNLEPDPGASPNSVTQMSYHTMMNTVKKRSTHIPLTVMRMMRMIRMIMRKFISH